MRHALQALEEVRATFTGTFERFGSKRGWQGREDKTVLLRGIVDTAGNAVCDHLWFNHTVAFARLRLQPGDVVTFDARVKEYVKGYFGRRDEVYRPVEVDYKLSHPTRVRKVQETHGTE